ncbi:MAG: PAS domain-containing protein, partial [Ignavibacteria bacterium]|nr:PAS domain-containing protein [Ignavibacteria bacterium]
VTLSSINTLNSSIEIEDLITERLLNNARMVRRLDSLNSLSVDKLINIGRENNLFRINIFDKNGDRILSNRVPEEDHIHPEGKVNRYEELEPILSGETGELIIGLKTASFSDEQRYAVAISRAINRGAIVLNLDAEHFLEFRKKIGIGRIVQDISDNSGIEYIVLQDSLGILAASSSVREMSTISDDVFLLKALLMDSTLTRIADFNDSEVYEVVKSLNYNDEFIGIFRIGLTLEEIRSAEARMVRRVIIISIILAAISIIVLGIIITNQNLKSVSKEFDQFKSFTNSLMQNMDEAVVIINKDSTIALFNDSAKKLFNIKRDDVVGSKLTELADCNISFIQDVVSDQSTFISVEKTVNINNQEIDLGITITPNYNLNRILESYTVVVKDFTEDKKLEEQAKRNEKLLAMGELASGVAHEIRNPINSIGMIAQRLNKEFTPKEDTDEYSSITILLKNEVGRINRIITQFLQYAKPIELQKTEVNVEKFFAEIYQLFKDLAEQKGISFKVEGDKDLTAKFDPELYKQTMMNIIQNAFDEVDTNGKVQVVYKSENDKLVITVSDNGDGIPAEDQKKIFDLYYTTKKEGNGLGLSISQKIISQHNGMIDIISNSKGTIFKITIPIS